MIKTVGHPRANIRNYVPEQILIAEKALGHYLPHKSIVHHVNNIRHDNRTNNLIVCQDDAYHKLIHYRTKAFFECGHANWLRCGYCGKFDKPENLYIVPGPKIIARHRKCARDYLMKWIKSKRREALAQV